MITFDLGKKIQNYNVLRKDSKALVKTLSLAQSNANRVSVFLSLFSRYHQCMTLLPKLLAITMVARRS